MIVYRGERFSDYNKPKRTPGKSKKFAVLARQGGRVKLVRFGDPDMPIKVGSRKHRESFRARHKCHTARDIFTARYWSCKAWELKRNPEQGQMLKQGYSKATIRDNIRTEIEAGKGQRAAVASSYRNARQVWKKRNKGKTMPAYLRKANPDDYATVLMKRRGYPVKKKARRVHPRVAAARRRTNPIKYVIQAINTRTGKQGWFTGDTIDDDIKKARTYKTSRSAVLVAKQLFNVLPGTWRLIVAHEHRPA